MSNTGSHGTHMCHTLKKKKKEYESIKFPRDVQQDMLKRHPMCTKHSKANELCSEGQRRRDAEQKEVLNCEICLFKTNR